MARRLRIKSAEKRRLAPLYLQAVSARVSPRTLPSPISELQRKLGNQRVAQLIQAKRLTPEGRILGLQPKLTVGAANDQYEQEADRVARQMMGMPDVKATSASASPAIPEEKDKEKTLQTKRAIVSSVASPLAASITPYAQRQAESAEEEDKEPAGQAKRENTALQRQPEMEDEKKEAEPIQTKPAQRLADSFEAGEDVESRLNQSKGGGSPLPDSVRAFMEPRFGMDFSQVRTHTGTEAIQMNRDVGAKAFTHGSDIYYGAGQSPGNPELTAHELTHVVQQDGAGTMLKRQHVADTGFRYTPPASVTRSIVEIQGIVGTTPDGVYGENTRIAVEKYQTKLKDVGFYSDTLDGKWGNNTEAAHVAFAIAPNVERRGYNCSGFAFKDYIFHNRAATKAIYSSMTKLADCSKSCSPHFHKFWMWEFDVIGTNTATGVSAASFKDFHTVGGQTDGSGKGPDQVMSKNGQRPVQGPKPPLDWEPVSGPALSQITGLPVPNRFVSVSNTKLECFCNDKLP